MYCCLGNFLSVFLSVFLYSRIITFVFGNRRVRICLRRYKTQNWLVQVINQFCFLFSIHIALSSKGFLSFLCHHARYNSNHIKKPPVTGATLACPASNMALIGCSSAEPISFLIDVAKLHLFSEIKILILQG